MLSGSWKLRRRFSEPDTIGGIRFLGEDVLLKLLGRQQLLGDAAIAGSEIMEGLRASGHRIPRADHILKHPSGTGLATGKRRRRPCGHRRHPLGQSASATVAEFAALVLTPPHSYEDIYSYSIPNG